MDDIVDRLSDVTDRDRISDAQEEILALRNKVAEQKTEIEWLQTELEQCRQIMLEAAMEKHP